MYKNLLAQTTLMMLPLVAMFLFLAVFVAVAIRGSMSSQEEMQLAHTGQAWARVRSGRAPVCCAGHR